MGRWGLHDAGIILGRVVTKWWCLITKGGCVGQEDGKKWLHNIWTLANYVICKLLSN